MDELTRERYGRPLQRELPDPTSTPDPWETIVARRQILGEALGDTIDRMRHTRLGLARRQRDRRLDRAVRKWQTD